MNFVYVNEDSIDHLLKCKICLKPFIDPVITRDNDRFCRLCVIEKFSINNTSNNDQQSSFIENLVSLEEKILHDMLDNLLVKCLDCQQTNIHRIEFQQHLLTECPKRIVLCKACDLKCSWSGSFDKYDDHVNQCTFELLRPILSENFQYQKQFEQYRIVYNEQQNQIEQLKKQIEQYENRTDKIQKGFKAFLEISLQQKYRYEKFQNDIQELQKDFTEQITQQNQLRNELQQLKEQFNQMNILLNELSNQNQRSQSNQFQNDIQQIKEQLNQYELGIQTIQEQELNYENQVKQLQKQDLYRKNEIIHMRELCDQHEIQIRLLARKKCIVPKPIAINNSKAEELIKTFKFNSDIDLDGKHLDNQDIEFISKTAIVDKQCRKLRLENNDITAKSATTLADTLYGNTTLAELHLSNNSISDMGVHALAQVLSINNWTLTWLELHSNNITDQGVEYLSEMLKTNKTLILLGLSFNQISDCGVRHLTSTIIYYNETLQWLHLASNKLITDASLENLIDMITHNRSLQALCLSNCSLSKDATNKLKQVVESNRNIILEV